MKTSRKSIMSSAHEKAFYLLSSLQTVCCSRFHQRELTWARADLPIRNWALVMQQVKGIKYLLGIRQANTICVRARVWALVPHLLILQKRPAWASFAHSSARNLFFQSTWQYWCHAMTYFGRSHTMHFSSGLSTGDGSLDRLLQLGSCGTLLASLPICVLASSASWLKSSLDLLKL